MAAAGGEHTSLSEIVDTVGLLERRLELYLSDVIFSHLSDSQGLFLRQELETAATLETIHGYLQQARLLGSVNPEVLEELMNNVGDLCLTARQVGMCQGEITLAQEMRKIIEMLKEVTVAVSDLHSESKVQKAGGDHVIPEKLIQPSNLQFTRSLKEFPGDEFTLTPSKSPRRLVGNGVFRDKNRKAAEIPSLEGSMKGCHPQKEEVELAKQKKTKYGDTFEMAPRPETEDSYIPWSWCRTEKKQHGGISLTQQAFASSTDHNLLWQTDINTAANPHVPGRRVSNESKNTCDPEDILPCSQDGSIIKSKSCDDIPLVLNSDFLRSKPQLITTTTPEQVPNLTEKRLKNGCDTVGESQRGCHGEQIRKPLTIADKDCHSLGVKRSAWPSSSTSSLSEMFGEETYADKGQAKADDTPRLFSNKGCFPVLNRNQLHEDIPTHHSLSLTQQDSDHSQSWQTAVTSAEKACQCVYKTKVLHHSREVPYFPSNKSCVNTPKHKVSSTLAGDLHTDISKNHCCVHLAQQQCSCVQHNVYPHLCFYADNQSNAWQCGKTHEPPCSECDQLSNCREHICKRLHQKPDFCSCSPTMPCKNQQVYQAPPYCPNSVREDQEEMACCTELCQRLCHIPKCYSFLITSGDQNKPFHSCNQPNVFLHQEQPNIITKQLDPEQNRSQLDTPTPETIRDQSQMSCNFGLCCKQGKDCYQTQVQNIHRLKSGSTLQKCPEGSALPSLQDKKFSPYSDSCLLWWNNCHLFQILHSMKCAKDRTEISAQGHAYSNQDVVTEDKLALEIKNRDVTISSSSEQLKQDEHPEVASSSEKREHLDSLVYVKQVLTDVVVAALEKHMQWSYPTAVKETPLETQVHSKELLSAPGKLFSAGSCQLTGEKSSDLLVSAESLCYDHHTQTNCITQQLNAVTSLPLSEGSATVGSASTSYAEASESENVKFQNYMHSNISVNHDEPCKGLLCTQLNTLVTKSLLNYTQTDPSKPEQTATSFNSHTQAELCINITGEGIVNSAVFSELEITQNEVHKNSLGASETGAIRQETQMKTAASSSQVETLCFDKRPSQSILMHTSLPMDKNICKADGLCNTEVQFCATHYNSERQCSGEYCAVDNPECEKSLNIASKGCDVCHSIETRSCPVSYKESSSGLATRCIDMVCNTDTQCLDVLCNTEIHCLDMVQSKENSCCDRLCNEGDQHLDTPCNIGIHGQDTPCNAEGSYVDCLHNMESHHHGTYGRKPDSLGLLCDQCISLDSFQKYTSAVSSSAVINESTEFEDDNNHPNADQDFFGQSTDLKTYRRCQHYEKNSIHYLPRMPVCLSPSDDIRLDSLSSRHHLGYPFSFVTPGIHTSEYFMENTQSLQMCNGVEKTGIYANNSRRELHKAAPETAHRCRNLKLGHGDTEQWKNLSSYRIASWKDLFESKSSLQTAFSSRFNHPAMSAIGLQDVSVAGVSNFNEQQLPSTAEMVNNTYTQSDHKFVSLQRLHCATLRNLSWLAENSSDPLWQPKDVNKSSWHTSLNTDVSSSPRATSCNCRHCGRQCAVPVLKLETQAGQKLSSSQTGFQYLSSGSHRPYMLKETPLLPQQYFGVTKTSESLLNPRTNLDGSVMYNSGDYISSTGNRFREKEQGEVKSENRNELSPSAASITMISSDQILGSQCIELGCSGDNTTASSPQANKMGDTEKTHTYFDYRHQDHEKNLRYKAQSKSRHQLGGQPTLPSSGSSEKQQGRTSREINKSQISAASITKQYFTSRNNPLNKMPARHTLSENCILNANSLMDRMSSEGSIFPQSKPCSSFKDERGVEVGLLVRPCRSVGIPLDVNSSNGLNSSIQCMEKERFCAVGRSESTGLYQMASNRLPGLHCCSSHPECARRTEEMSIICSPKAQFHSRGSVRSQRKDFNTSHYKLCAQTSRIGRCSDNLRLKVNSATVSTQPCQGISSFGISDHYDKTVNKCYNKLLTQPILQQPFCCSCDIARYNSSANNYSSCNISGNNETIWRHPEIEYIYDDPSTTSSESSVSTLGIGEFVQLLNEALNRNPPESLDQRDAMILVVLTSIPLLLAGLAFLHPGMFSCLHDIFSLSLPPF